MCDQCKEMDKLVEAEVEKMKPLVAHIHDGHGATAQLVNPPKGIKGEPVMMPSLLTMNLIEVAAKMMVKEGVPVDLVVNLAGEMTARGVTMAMIEKAEKGESFDDEELLAKAPVNRLPC